MRAHAKNWTEEPKQESRMLAVVEPYWALFGSSIPDDRQYWTLGGKCVTNDGAPAVGSEIDQLLRLGFLRRDQFHSAERHEDIYEANAAAWPGAHWYHDDIYHAMAQAWSEGWFAPAVVFFDSMRTPERASIEVARIMRLLTDWSNETGQGDVLFLANFVLHDPHHREVERDGLTITTALEREPLFRAARLLGDWSFPEKHLRYKSTGSGLRGRSEMGVFTAALRAPAHAAVAA